MNKTILITGAQGFLGRYLTAALLKEFPGSDVIGIGRSPFLSDCFTHSITIKTNKKIAAPLPAELAGIFNERYRYFSIDINNRKQVEELLNTYKPNAIFHLASGLKGDTGGKLLSTNITGTLNLLSACKDRLINIPFISVSSGGVYGFPSKAEDIPFSEQSPCNPEDTYQLTKAAEETIVKDFCEQFDMPWMILRVFNIIGPGQDERHVCGYFVSELVSIKDGYKAPILKTGGLDSVRDFVDVRDVADNVTRLFANRQFNQVFNISSGKPETIKDVLEYCLDSVFGVQRPVEISSSQGSVTNSERIDQHFGDNTKLLSSGGAINFMMSSSIADMVSYYHSINRQ